MNWINLAFEFGALFHYSLFHLFINHFELIESNFQNQLNCINLTFEFGGLFHYLLNLIAIYCIHLILFEWQSLY